MILNAPHLELTKRLYLKPAVFLFIGCMLISGCSGSKKISTDTKDPEVKYSIISVIHADANYVYHNDGELLKANEEALKQSVSIAENASKGEFFIFHQKPERKAFLFFPKKDRELYHYRNGKLLRKINYSPLGGGFDKEVELYLKYSVKNDTQSYFLYFGHEIPTYSNRNYHHSMPDQEFNTEVFTNDLRNFTENFELSILSTCNNGNPYMLNKLKNISKKVVASPQNLHLSYLHIEDLNMLENESMVPTIDLADSIASSSYQLLTEKLQTAVTIGVYDSESLKKNTDFTKMVKHYEEYIERRNAGEFFTDNSDCSALESLMKMPEKGVKIYYKAAAFGRKASKNTHSGWGCKK